MKYNCLVYGATLLLAMYTNLTNASEDSFCMEGISLTSEIDVSSVSKLDSEIPFIVNFLNEPYKDRYQQFSENYKIGLTRAFNIENAEQYDAYLKRTNYERNILNSKIIKIDQNSDNVLSVTTLACWEKEGYSGIETYIFVIEKIDDQWKITHIAK